MLQSLSVRNFALIDHIELEFSAGFTAFIGETGAGKSIIIDALLCALGERTSPDTVRVGQKKAVVEAVFRVGTFPVVEEFLRNNELDSQGESVITRREITATSSRCFINDTPVQAAVMRAFGNIVMEFHGQHDTQGLLSPQHHTSILDEFALHEALLESMYVAWEAAQSAKRSVAGLEQLKQDADRVRLSCTEIIEHIGAIAPVPGETEELEAVLNKLEHREHIVSLAAGAKEALDGDAGSAASSLHTAIEHLTRLSDFDTRIAEMMPELQSALTSCRETAGLLSDIVEGLELNPALIEQQRNRLAVLQRLVRRYGSVPEALALLQEAESKLEVLADVDQQLADAHVLYREKLAVAARAAKKLSTSRQKAARKLSAILTTMVQQMGMTSATATVSLTESALGRSGSDTVEFLLAPTATEQPKPIRRTASGGELSRYMLALKSALAGSQAVGTIVFDEIDTGISGKVARHVGHLIRQLSATTQMICITHLPQIASLAHNLIRVSKHEGTVETTVTAESIHGSDAEVEVARLLSGTTVTETALQSARELIAATDQ